MIQKKTNLEESAQKYLKEASNRGEVLFEKWRKSVPGEGLENLYDYNPIKAKNVAVMLENQERHLQQYSETTISQNFQTRPENVLKIVRIGSANSNRGNIFTEIPLMTTDDAIYFLNLTYENTITGKDQTADEYMYEKAYQFSAGEVQYIDTVGTAGTTYSITVDNLPILPNKVFILLDGQLVGYDDGSLTITPQGTLLTSGSIDAYSTGVVSLIFASAIAATSTIRVITHFDAEESAMYTNYPKISINVSKERFNARLMPLGYSYSMMTATMFETTGLGNLEDDLLLAVGDEHAKAQDYRAVGIGMSIAKTNTAYSFNTDFASQGEISDKLHAQKISSFFSDMSGDIQNDIKRGVLNRIVAGSKAVTYFKKHDLWKDDLSQRRTGMYKAGTLSDIEVYQCPTLTGTLASNEGFATYANPEQPLDVGVAFGVLTQLTSKLAYPQFYVDANIGIVEDFKIINKKFARKFTLANLPSYTV